MFAHPVYLQRIGLRVKFVGHRVKVKAKITEAKSRNLQLRSVKLRSAINPVL